MSHDPPFSTYDDYKQERLHDTPPAEKERMQLEHRIREHLATAMSPDNLTTTREKYDQALALLREAADSPPHTCKFCGAPSWLDPSEQDPPPDYCHESDHGSPESRL